MSDVNKQNLAYFEARTMRELYTALDEWQRANGQRFLSLSIESDGGNYCCIALTNPAEVVITSADGHHHAAVNRFGLLAVTTD
ncbi:hypothetical protein D7D52_30410 [Nocardia yunnanensis]|uniref:Uncharacterized protein n=1 Tax=Nocardia yunnanensis TaxID=2382165 RepID=A0A386ZIU5_9NOCA|nr:hypothetical protein [Nocardia yunnanensis]AYF77416.1 hypothetical protein D7D52_30410 [Nocardia yunnanensis]